MEKLVLTHHWGDEAASGTEHIAFEYESKDKFVFDVLEKYENHEWEWYGAWKSDYETSKVEILGVYMSKGELENIEKYVRTLNEWFEYEKEKEVTF